MTWREWLETERARNVLFKCALYLVNKHSWITEFLIEQNPEALTGELWLYCRSNAEKWDVVKPFDSLENKDSKSIINWIIANFLNFMIDKVRTPQYSPQKYLYARIRKALKSDGAYNIRTCVRNRVTYYTYSEKLEWGYEHCFNLQEGNYKEWSFPKDVSLKDIYQEKTLIYIAEFFWQEVRNRTGSILWVPVQQLLRYILSFIPVPVKYFFEPLNGLGDEEDDIDWSGIDNDPEISTHYSEALDLNADFLLKSLDIGKLAEKCAQGLDPNERKVLDLYYHEKYSMKDIAEKLGYSGPSGVNYILEKARNRIRKFCERQPYLSPPGLDEKLFNSFMDNLLMFCKNLSCNRK